MASNALLCTYGGLSSPQRLFWGVGVEGSSQFQRLRSGWVGEWVHVYGGGGVEGGPHSEAGERGGAVGGGRRGSVARTANRKRNERGGEPNRGPFTPPSLCPPLSSLSLATDEGGGRRPPEAPFWRWEYEKERKKGTRFAKKARRIPLLRGGRERRKKPLLAFCPLYLKGPLLPPFTPRVASSSSSSSYSTYEQLFY